MTMAEVLDGIRGLGELFDRHAKRLQALERETGMEPDPDDDEEKAKKAADAKDAKDDDDDKDRAGPGRQVSRQWVGQNPAGPPRKRINWPAAGGMGTSGSIPTRGPAATGMGMPV